MTTARAIAFTVILVIALMIGYAAVTTINSLERPAPVCEAGVCEGSR